MSWFWLWGFFLSDAVDESLGGGSAVHAAALVWSPGIVAAEIVVEHGLHLVGGLEPGLAALDTEMLVKEGSVQRKRCSGPTLSRAAALG